MRKCRKEKTKGIGRSFRERYTSKFQKVRTENVYFVMIVGLIKACIDLFIFGYVNNSL